MVKLVEKKTYDLRMKGSSHPAPLESEVGSGDGEEEMKEEFSSLANS